MRPGPFPVIIVARPGADTEYHGGLLMLEAIQSWGATAGSYLVENLIPAVCITAVGLLVNNIVLRLTKKALGRSKLEKVAHSLIISVVQAALVIILVVSVAAKLGIDVTSIVALASVLTLALSLALQNALTNVIGGFTLLYTHPFASGDYVEIAGQAGTVQEIGLAYTKLATIDNKVVSIPNSAVVAAEIINFSEGGIRRIDLHVSCSYDTPVDEVLSALVDAARDVGTVLEDPAPFAGVREYGDSAIIYELQVWCSGTDYWATHFGTNKRIKEIFDDRGLEMTYPHLNVHIKKENQ